MPGKNSLARIGSNMINERMKDLAGIDEANMFGKEQASKGNVSIWKPAQLEDKLADIYQELVTLKLEMDNMEEIPNYLTKLYNLTNKSMSKVGDAKKEVYNLRMEAKKIHNKR